MQVDIPDQVIESLRDALVPVIERLIEEKVQEKRPLLLSVSQVAEDLSCSRASVYGLIRGGYLEAIQVGRTYKIPSETLLRYVEELLKPKYERNVVTARANVGSSVRTRKTPSRSGSHRVSPEPLLVPATKQPRSPRQKTKKMSKKELAESRCSVPELAERWWGQESATALVQRSGVALARNGTEEATFRYGDLLDWVANNGDQFEQWLQDFDPVFNR